MEPRAARRQSRLHHDCARKVAADSHCVELLKGHELLAGVQFALTWSAISTIIFMGTRMYYVSRGRNCPLCNDLPEMEKDEHSSTHS